MLESSPRSFTSTRAKLIDALLNSLSNHFEADEELLNDSSVIQLDIWPDKISVELYFGDGNTALLTEKLCPNLEPTGIDLGIIEPKWIRLKSLMCQRFQMS